MHKYSIQFKPTRNCYQNLKSLHPKQSTNSTKIAPETKFKQLSSHHQAPAPPTMRRKFSKAISFEHTDATARRRSSSPPPHQAFSEPIMEETVESAEEIINRWSYHHSDHHDSSAPSLFLNSGSEETLDFMAAIKDLHVVMKFLISVNPNSNLLVRGQKLVQTAMKRLEREFHLMLKTNKQYLDHESVSTQSSSSYSSRSSAWSSATDYEEDDGSTTDNSTHQCDGLKNSKIVMDDLKLIADSMINAGYTRECIAIYKATRKSTVHGALCRLGIDPSSSPPSYHKMDWSKMETKMKNWKSAVKVAVRIIFNGEKILCDHVFSSASPSIREICFSEVTRDGALALVAEPEHMAKTKKSPEKIFRFLDIYEAMMELGPEIESIFICKSTSFVKSQAEASLNKLAECIRPMLTEFEAAIQKDSSKSSIPGGGLHPLTRYVMNYLCFLSEYADALAGIIAADSSSSPATTLPERYFGSPTEGPKSKLSEKFCWLILILLCKLDLKAELYHDISLCYLFLSNNLRYVMSKVQSSSIQFIVGAGWVRKHDDVLRKYAANYERTGWSKVVAVLPNDSAVEITSISQAKEVLVRFNVEFLEVYRKQLEWVVVDQRLREEVKSSLRKKVAPKYREIYEIYRRMVEESEEEVVVGASNFTPEELDKYLEALFSGVQQQHQEGGGSSSGSSSSHGSSSSSSSAVKTASAPISKAGRGLRAMMLFAAWK